MYTYIYIHISIVNGIISHLQVGGHHLALLNSPCNLSQPDSNQYDNTMNACAWDQDAGTSRQRNQVSKLPTGFFSS